ncbi:MAG: alpha-L-fucosidase, partial [Candidatus Hydrogenedentes bacterium]|nr:alpha-L-fucosidase [Candidatus Hydrogenedentota bacterium]
MKRRAFLQTTGASLLAPACMPVLSAAAPAAPAAPAEGRGDQRLSLEALQQWEALGYGMFIHFGMSTFVNNELPSGKDAPELYAPDQLDVDLLTSKHVAGHCLWPTKHSDYSVVNSVNTTDVMAKFVEACRKHGILPGFYYCSWDNHNRFGSKTPSDQGGDLPAYTTSLYQDFQAAQITELMTTYGPFAEVWVDIPGVLGRGYRTFLYQHIAALQPNTVIMMNSGISSGETYDINYAWPSDL